MWPKHGSGQLEEFLGFCFFRFGGKLYAMAEEFVSEEIVPVAGTFDPAAMAKGAPALPARFRWRNTEYTIARDFAALSTKRACTIAAARRPIYRRQTTDDG
jgi:hypothetical protein